MSSLLNARWTRVLSVILSLAVALTFVVPPTYALAGDTAASAVSDEQTADESGIQADENSQGVLANEFAATASTDESLEIADPEKTYLLKRAKAASDKANGVEKAEDGSTVSYYDGVYEGEAYGYRSTIKVAVTIENRAIASVKVTSHQETASYWAKIGNSFYQSIVDAQSTNVDTVSGATVSTKAILKAVDKALAKAALPLSQGSGTQDDPYLITSVSELQNFGIAVEDGNNYAGEYVKLGADIDLKDIASFDPIGTEGTAKADTTTIFAGTFDGAGHSISNLKIALTDQASEMNVGLFSALQNSATVKDLSLDTVDISLKGSAVLRAGGIAGDTVSGTNGDYTASHVAIDACSVTGAVTVDTSGAKLAFAAGVVGRQNISCVISNCWTEVDVTSFSRGSTNSAYAGGIFGMAGNNTAVVNCASFGDAYGASPKSPNFGGMAGGMGAMLSGKMYNVVATGDQTIGNAGTTNSWVGMLTGQNTTAGMTKQDDGSYTYPDTGIFRGYAYYNSEAKLAVDVYDSDGAVSSSTTLETVASGTGSTYDTAFAQQTEIVKGFTASELASESFTSTMNNNMSAVRALLDAYGLSDVVLNIWEFEDGRALPCGEMWCDPSLVFASGTGTEDDPHMIMTTTQLKNFAAAVDAGTDYAGEYVALGENLDLSAIETFNPIGTEAAAKADTATIFAGTFDGRGNTISNLTIALSELTADTNVGLFSWLQSGAVVKNLNLEDIDIDVGSSFIVRAGGIAGNTVAASTDAPTLIDSCSVSGSIDADTSGAKLLYVGAVAAQLGKYAYVTNCWTDTDVTGISTGGTQSAYVGGIFGMAANDTAVVNCASFGSAYGASPKSTNFGGMAGGMGGMFAGKMYNVVATGDQTIGNAGTTNSWVGMLTGQNTTAGMTKQDDGSYTYPDTGIFRGYAYYNNEAKLSVDVYGTDGAVSSSTTLTTAPSGTGSAYDTAFAQQTNIVRGLAASSMASQSMASTLNGNLHKVLVLLNAYGISGSSLKTWELVDGRVTPTGDAYYEIAPDPTLFEGGTGTQDDPFQIKTEEQLRAFATSLGEHTDYVDCFVELVADIDVSSAAWTPVGAGDYAFNGSFDGNGYTITGMSIGTRENLDEETEAESAIVEGSAVFVGMFGVLGEEATVKNVNLSDLFFYVSCETGVYVGGIAGYMAGEASSYEGAVIDSCTVQGTLLAEVNEQNLFVGGIAAYQYKGAIINCRTYTDITTITNSGAIAEGGGLVALNNRGLVANSYSKGTLFGSGSRENSNEGAAAISSLIGVNAGSLVNCYGSSVHEAAEFSTYVGAVSGWITGIGKSYLCWYDGDAYMAVDGQQVKPVEKVGTQVPSGVSDEGDVYTGGLSDRLTEYTADTYRSIASSMNESFAAFPIDISAFGLTGDVLKKWTYDEDTGEVTFGTELSAASYEQPDVEKVPYVEPTLRDGTWYGRSASKKTVVKITVSNGEVTATETLSGRSAGSYYEEAVALAKEKAVYGDTTNYDAPDTTVFAGGAGTASNPYKISNEAQLRYIAQSMNEENLWEGVYFKQTADIALSSDEWLPIGWGIYTEINNTGTQYCAYPFKGSFDGGDYSISGLTIGSGSEASADPRMSYVAGLFGFAAGEAATNALPASGERVTTISNVHVKDANIMVASRYQNFVGALAGNLQNGFYVDNCSAEGTVNVVSEEGITRAGGLAGNVLRGQVTNCWADVAVSGCSEALSAYVGALYAMDNRATTVNSYALGSVTGGSANSNKTYVGGLVGQAGGYLYNCYTMGDVTATKATAFKGAISGNFAGIAAARNCYYNADMALEVAGAKTEVIANGKSMATSDDALAVYAKSKTELASAAFATQLNANITSSTIASELAIFNSVVAGLDLTSVVYYTGNGSDLKAWTAKNGHAVYVEKEASSSSDTTPKATMGNDGTAFGKGASESVVTAAITKLKSDADPAGTVYNVLKAKSVKTTKKSLKLTWTKPSGAKSFIVYGNKSGAKNKMKKLTKTTGKKVVLKKIAGKKVVKGTSYKLMVVAFDKNGKVVSSSKIVHVASAGGKLTNCKKVTTKAKKNKVTLKAKKTFKLKGKAVKKAKKLKLKSCRKICYESTNTKIATVTKKGVVKGIKKGTCFVYAYAQNGVAAKIKVTVK